jgi:hypothetical protein
MWRPESGAWRLAAGRWPLAAGDTADVDRHGGQVKVRGVCFSICE